MSLRHLFVIVIFFTFNLQPATASSLIGSDARPMAMASLATHCIEFSQIKIGSADTDASECVVMDSGVIGKQADQTFYYALYCLTPAYRAKTDNCAQRRAHSPEYYGTDAIAIFVQNSQTPELQPMLVRADIEIGMFNYGRPYFLTVSQRQVLVVPIQISGTGNGNASEVYVQEGQSWLQVDTESWLTDLKAQLPKDQRIQKGVWPDLRHMIAVISLYRQGDANCCPSGDTTLVNLALQGQKLSLDSVKVFTEPNKLKFDEVPRGSELEFNRPVVKQALTPTLTPVPQPGTPAVNYPRMRYPFTLSSWTGNGFGVVAELKGTLHLEGDKARIQADSLRLRQIVKCDPKCVTVKSVKVEIYGESDAEHFSTHAASPAIEVNKTFARPNGEIDLGSQQFEITLRDELELSKLWLGLQIKSADNGSYYTHTERNFFARVLQANGKAGDVCANVQGIEQAIETRCNAVLEQQMSKWYRPLVIWWERHFGDWHAVSTAIHENNQQALQVLVAHGVSVDEPDKTGNSTLMIAASNGNVELVKLLLKYGAKVNYQVEQNSPQRGRTALISAIYSGDGTVVETLLNAGASTNLPDSHGWLAVHYAAYYANLDGLRALKNHNVSLETNTRTDRGETPLMLAAQYGKLAAIQALLELGASKQNRDRYGKNAYDYAEFFHQAAAAQLLQQ